jgi:hypothetical protein
MKDSKVGAIGNINIIMISQQLHLHQMLKDFGTLMEICKPIKLKHSLDPMLKLFVVHLNLWIIILKKIYFLYKFNILVNVILPILKSPLAETGISLMESLILL